MKIVSRAVQLESANDVSLLHYGGLIILNRVPYVHEVVSCRFVEFDLEV